MGIKKTINLIKTMTAGDQIRIEGVQYGSSRFNKICDVYNAKPKDVEHYINSSKCSYLDWLKSKEKTNG